MARKCYLEVFSPYNSLKEDCKVKYWEEYWDKVIPDVRKLGLSSTLSSFVKERISPMLEKEGLYPIHHKLDDKTMYVFNEGKVSEAYIPDAWVILFNPTNIVKTFTTEDLEGKNFDEITNFQRGVKSFALESRVGLVRKNLNSRMRECKENGTTNDFNDCCIELSNWLEGMHGDSIIRLYTGEIFNNECVERFVQLNPFECMVEYIKEFKDYDFLNDTNYRGLSKEVLDVIG